jgi:multiple sugar transport system permease protein
MKLATEETGVSTLLEWPAAVSAPRRSFLTRARAAAREIKPLWFLLPALLPMCVWIYYPVLKTIYYSFVEWNMLPMSAPEWVDFRNYELLLAHPNFAQALWNTLLYIAGMLPFSVIIPMILAIVTERMSARAKNIYRALFFLPMVMPPVTVSVVWRWLFHPTNGIVNQILINLGLIDSGINFLGAQESALFSIIVIAGWKMIGFSTLMFSAALTGIDKAYYEAADVDNVSHLRQTLTITLPLISPMVLYMIMLSLLFTAQWTFAYINVLTQGGPAGASANVYYLMYTYGIRSFNVGMGSAAAILFFLLFGIIAMLMTFAGKKLAFYDN